MKNLSYRNDIRKIIILLMIVSAFNRLYPVNGQSVNSSEVVFSNTPVLFKEGEKSYQQVLAEYISEKSGKIVFYLDGKELLNTSLRAGINRILLTVPAVKEKKKISFTVNINEQKAKKYSFPLAPPKKRLIYFVHHTHTDMGYTREQSEILAEHLRYIDYALDYCDQTDDMPDDARFRWTCEASWVVREYLRSRPAEQIERFKRRIKEGRIEVTGLYANMSEIMEENQVYDLLQPLKEFGQHGIPIKTVMQNDVNGIAWGLPDFLKNTGVKYLIMGINTTRARLPFDMPTVFWWEAPSGERLLAYRAGHYMDGNRLGIELENFSPETMLWYIADLDKRGYPFDRMSIQYQAIQTDNSPPGIAVSEMVRQWNEKYESPQLRLATSNEFMEYVEKNYADRLPVYRKAWLDWWVDGWGAASRETAETRRVQNMKQGYEGLFAMVSMMGGELKPSLEAKMDQISDNILFFCEHTAGSHYSSTKPFSEDATRQWLQKAAFAWESLKAATLLHEEAQGRLQPFLTKTGFPAIYVFNPLGWMRSGVTETFIDYEIIPSGRKVRIIDLATGKEVPSQIKTSRKEGAYWLLEVSDVPAMGYKALKIEVAEEPLPSETYSNTGILENQYYKLIIDKETGYIRSLLDKELNLELADNQTPYHIGQPVHESFKLERRLMIPNYDKYENPFNINVHREQLKDGEVQKNFDRTTVSNVKTTPGADDEIWQSIFITSDLVGFEKGFPGEPKGIELEIRLYKNVKKIEFAYKADKMICVDPEALYVAFPFSFPDSRIIFETIGGTLAQGEQLPGSSTDWNAAHNFVAVRGKNGQVVIVSDEVPLWQFSDFNAGKYDRIPRKGKPWLYSWVMNNYWWTNWRVYQEGSYSWSYQITSGPDTTNTFAAKFARNERNPFPARTYPAVPLGAGHIKSPVFEAIKVSGDENALLVNCRPAFRDETTVFLRFREIEGLPAEIQISSGIPGRSIKKITEVNCTGIQTGGTASSIKINPFEVKFFEVQFE
jgi:alpha-mannosidase